MTPFAVDGLEEIALLAIVAVATESGYDEGGDDDVARVLYGSQVMYIDLLVRLC